MKQKQENGKTQIQLIAISNEFYTFCNSFVLVYIKK